MRNSPDNTYEGLVHCLEAQHEALQRGDPVALSRELERFRRLARRIETGGAGRRGAGGEDAAARRAALDRARALQQSLSLGASARLQEMHDRLHALSGRRKALRQYGQATGALAPSREVIRRC